MATTSKKATSSTSSCHPVDLSSSSVIHREAASASSASSAAVVPEWTEEKKGNKSSTVASLIRTEPSPSNATTKGGPLSVFMSFSCFYARLNCLYLCIITIYCFTYALHLKILTICNYYMLGSIHVCQ